MHGMQPLPPTAKQLAYARSIASRLDMAIPHSSLASRASLSNWIDGHKAGQGGLSGVATSRQVAYAEKISRAKRRAIPAEAFRSAQLMSRWIDANK